MARMLSCILRVPVNRFRKPAQAQPAAAMSIGTRSEIKFPEGFRRIPPTQEEIDYVNAGGAKDLQLLPDPPAPNLIIKIPRSIIVQHGEKKEHISFKIHFQDLKTK